MRVILPNTHGFKYFISFKIFGLPHLQFKPNFGLFRLEVSPLLFYYKKKMINFTCIDFFTILISTVFFFCLFQGYFSIKNIKNFLRLHPLIVSVLKLLGLVLFICLLLYLFSGEDYGAGPEGDDSIPSKPVMKINENKNIINIRDSIINILYSVSTGLTNLGTGAAVAAGMKVAATIAKTTGFSSSAAKVGIIGAGAAMGGVNSIIKKKNNSLTDSIPKSNTGNGNVGFTFFPIHESADIHTVVSLLEVNCILHICILYLPIALFILYISTMVVENKWNLMFIKNIFGERFFNLLIKSLSYICKYNKIWMFIGWVFLMFCSIVSLYISYFLLNNIDIINEIVQQSK